MAQAEQFMLRMGTYGPDLLDDQGQMPEYRERVKAVITPEVRDLLREAGDAPPSSWSPRPGVAARPRCSRPASPRSTTTPRPRWWPAPSPTATRREGRRARQPVPFRIEVQLVKTDGEWLVDDFTPGDGRPTK